MHKFYRKCSGLLSLVIFKEKYITQKGIKLGSSKRKSLMYMEKITMEGKTLGKKLLGILIKLKR